MLLRTWVCPAWLAPLHDHWGPLLLLMTMRTGQHCCLHRSYGAAPSDALLSQRCCLLGLPQLGPLVLLWLLQARGPSGAGGHSQHWCVGAHIHRAQAMLRCLCLVVAWHEKLDTTATTTCVPLLDKQLVVTKGVVGRPR